MFKPERQEETYERTFLFYKLALSNVFSILFYCSKLNKKKKLFYYTALCHIYSIYFFTFHLPKAKMFFFFSCIQADQVLVKPSTFCPTSYKQDDFVFIQPWKHGFNSLESKRKSKIVTTLGLKLSAPQNQETRKHKKESTLVAPRLLDSFSLVVKRAVGKQ